MWKWYHPWAGGPGFYKEAGRAKAGEKSSEVTSISPRCLLQLPPPGLCPDFTSWLSVIRWTKPFFSKLLLVILFITATQPTPGRKDLFYLSAYTMAGTHPSVHLRIYLHMDTILMVYSLSLLYWSNCVGLLLSPLSPHPFSRAFLGCGPARHSRLRFSCTGPEISHFPKGVEKGI